MWRYFELLSFRSLEEIRQFQQEVDSGKNPRDIKFLLAEEIIARFHSEDAASAAREQFIAQFQKGAVPDDIPEFDFQGEAGGIPLANLLKDAGLVASTSDAHRMVKQGAVKKDGEKIADSRVKIVAGGPYIFQVGKRRFAKVTIGQ